MQFERQIIAERTRDKIRAARRRRALDRWDAAVWATTWPPRAGSWVLIRMRPPVVRAIFELYAEKPSLVDVALELNRRGWRRESPGPRRTGKLTAQGKAWDRRTLANLLRDPIYIGQIRNSATRSSRASTGASSPNRYSRRSSNCSTAIYRDRGVQRPKQARCVATRPAPLLGLQRGHELRAGQVSR